MRASICDLSSTPFFHYAIWPLKLLLLINVQMYNQNSKLSLLYLNVLVINLLIECVISVLHPRLEVMSLPQNICPSKEVLIKP